MLLVSRVKLEINNVHYAAVFREAQIKANVTIAKGYVCSSWKIQEKHSSMLMHCNCLITVIALSRGIILLLKHMTLLCVTIDCVVVESALVLCPRPAKRARRKDG